jgi:hypothetical protein
MDEIFRDTCSYLELFTIKAIDPPPIRWRRILFEIPESPLKAEGWWIIRPVYQNFPEQLGG